MRLSRRRSMVTVAATAALVLAGCSSNQSNTGEQGAAADAKAKVVTIGIDVPFHPIFDYLMATSAPAFKKLGYDVKFKVLDATTQVPAFGRGDLDVITTVPSFMPRIKEQYGIDTTYFFPMARWTPGPELLVPKDSPITSIADLKGKKVAIAPLSSRFGAEQAAVEAATGDDITSYFDLSQTDAAAQQLSLGRVDGAFLEAPATAPLLAKGFRSAFSVQQAFKKAFGDPAVMNGGFIASSAFAKKNPEFVKALVAQTQTAWTTFQQDPDKVLATASKVSGLPVDQLKLVAEVLNLAKTTPEQKRVTEQDVATWGKLFPLLQKSGFIKTTPTDVSSMFEVTGG